MGVITSSSFAKLLWPGLNSIYGKAYNDYPVEWDKLFEKNTSDRAYEEDLGLSSFGLASVKTEGGPIVYDTERQGFTSRYNHVVYALGFIITREIYEDDQYGKVGAQKAKALARSMRQTKEIIGANIYNRATTAGYTGGDGIVLCSTAHLNVAGGTYSNKIATDAELRAVKAEHRLDDIRKAEFMKQYEKQDFEVIVSDIKENFIIVLYPERMVYGKLFYNSRYFHLGKDGYSIIGHNGEKIMIGDIFNARLTKVNILNGEVVFSKGISEINEINHTENNRKRKVRRK